MENPSSLPIEWWPIERVRPYEKNARKIPQTAINAVAKSIESHGFVQPIVVDSEGTIVLGHVRRLAALKLGLSGVPVHVSNLPPDKIKTLRLADNRTHEYSAWDIDLLTAEMLELNGAGVDLSLTTFSQHELDSFLVASAHPGEDDIPPVPAVPVTQPGDLWLLGEHRLYCGSCTDPASVAAVLDGRQPKLMVTDPPYGISLDSEWRDRAGLNGGDLHRTAVSKAAAKANPIAQAEPSYMKHRVAGHTETTVSGDTRIDWSEAFELVPSLEVVYVWHASIGTREVWNGLERIGFLYPQQIIWDKGRTVLTRTHWWYQHEPCLYMRKKNAPWYGKAGECSTVWQVASPKFMLGPSKDPGDGKLDHPTQKPVELMRKSILNHTLPGEFVYEPFAGSGTTLAAAELTGRLCCTIEIEPRYCDVVVARWEKLSGRKAERQSPPQPEPGGQVEAVAVA